MRRILKNLHFFSWFVLLFTCIFHVDAVINGMRAALQLCAISIIPSLFLFLVLSNLILSVLLSGERNFSPKALVFLLGAVCGFPTGAILCDRLCHDNILCETDAAQLLPLCNNASPAFIIGAIGTAMLEDTRIGILLYIAQIAASLLLLFSIKIPPARIPAKTKSFSFSEAFFSAIEKSIGSILKICALICLFSAILSVIRAYCGKDIYTFLAVLFEIGTGSSAAASLFSSARLPAILLLAFACGWSGICVHLQILFAVKSIKIKYFNFAFKKGYIALLTCVFTILGYKLFFNS